jgi:glyceraldehyde 3-phosphate dehydrogenase
MARIVINGFGRIGRSTLRTALRDAEFTPVAISDVQELPSLAALFAVDSNYGRWPDSVRANAGVLHIGERAIPYINVRDGLRTGAHSTSI